MKTHFYEITSPECNYYSPDRIWKPAIAFELAYNLTDIAGDYTFPDDLTPTEFENQAAHYSEDVHACYEIEDYTLRKISALPDVTRQRMETSWAALQALNPELQTINASGDEPLLLFDALCGAGALINADDIKFMIDLRRKTGRIDTVESAKELIPTYTLQHDEVSNLLHHPSYGRLGWIVSPPTLNKIKNSLQNRTPAPTPE